MIVPVLVHIPHIFKSIKYKTNLRDMKEQKEAYEKRLVLEAEKSCSTISHEGAWVDKSYSSYSFSTSALDGG
jgi:hypothetical protein